MHHNNYPKECAYLFFALQDRIIEINNSPTPLKKKKKKKNLIELFSK